MNTRSYKISRPYQSVPTRRSSTGPSHLLYLRDCLVSHLPSVSRFARVGLRTGGPSTPAFSARSWATNLKSRPPLGQKSLVLACGLTYQTVSMTINGPKTCFNVLRNKAIERISVGCKPSRPKEGKGERAKGGRFEDGGSKMARPSGNAGDPRCSILDPQRAPSLSRSVSF